MGRKVYVEAYVMGSARYGAASCSVDSSVECVVAISAGVIAEEVVGVDVQVVGEPCKVLVV